MRGLPGARIVMNGSFMTSGEVNDSFMTLRALAFTVRAGGAGGRCDVANDSLGTSEVPNEVFSVRLGLDRVCAALR